MRRYIVTTHEGVPGARLSLVGQWGNLNFGDRVAAMDYATKDGEGSDYKIEFESLPAPRKGVLINE